jgi:SsrA-binding protein
MAAPPKKPDAIQPISENRRARARYAFDEALEVGIELRGSEVKSIREGKLELSDAYAQVDRGQLILLNAFIPPYKNATVFGHEPKRPRKLLAHRAEIDRLEGKIRQRGYTLVPLRAYFKGGKVKLEIALGKGKDLEDRREDIKEREQKREARAAMARRRGER